MKEVKTKSQTELNKFKGRVHSYTIVRSTHELINKKYMYIL